MTTLETVLLCLAGVETLITCIWSWHIRKQVHALLIFAMVRAIRADEKEAEYNSLLDQAQVWINAR